MKREPKICPCCGQKIMRNRHCFSGGLAQILLKTAERFMAGQPFHLQQDLDLGHNEYANFQKLRYFGLAEKYHTTLGCHVSGKWILTIRALNLIRGEEAIEEWVETFNNEVVEKSDKRIGIANAIGTYTIPAEYAKYQRPAIKNKDGQTMFNFEKVA